MRHLILFCFTLVAVLASAAQTGLIRGTVYEDETGEPLIGVTVFVKGTSVGATTDLDGKFTLEVEAGTVDIQISYISFKTLMIEGVEVKPDQVTHFENIRLQENSQQLETVVVTAEVTRKSETALMALKRKSVAIIDGISAGKIQITGDGTAGEAAKRVPGVTSEGGKYIYVRGLGDRYTKTTLNEVDVPGLDPDRNSLQMDIFPTSLIDNLVVRKNFTADMSAEFTGGIMNIETKAFPDEKFFNVSVGASFNPDMHFNSDYLAYQGGPTDFLGFDDGTRALPAGARSQKIPTPISGHSADEVNRFVSSFNPDLSAQRQTSFLDYSASLSFGNQIELKNKQEVDYSAVIPKLGYILSLSYKTDYKYYDDVVYGEYQRIQAPEVTQLRYATMQNGELGERNVLVGVLGGVAYKNKVSKLRLTAMRLQNGESTAGIFNIDNNAAAIGQSGYEATSHSLEYTQRSLTNVLLGGTHVMENSGWEIDWRLSPTLSTMDDPDIRKTAFTITSNEPYFSAGAGGNPSRMWRSLNEWNATAKVDITKTYQLWGEDAKLKFGASHTYKQRDYEILFFDVQFFANQSWPDADPARVLNPDNIYPNKPNSIYYQSGNNNPNPNAYESNSNNASLYVSNEFTPVDRLKAILGVRVEHFVLKHTGRDQGYASGDTENGRNLNNEPVLESVDLFPSAILIYSLSPDQNLRGSYSRTIARPSFKELSFAQILDPISNRIFNGSLFPYSDWDGNLTETRVNNFDLRWEYFMENGQVFSVSGFYKQFDNPIELVRIPEQQTSTEYQPRNVGDGRLYGVELELRKNLGFLSSALGHFNLDANATFVESVIDMSSKEFNARKAYEKTGENIEPTREMAGQSSYVVNGGITYSDFEAGIEAGLFYNVKGPTLLIVGSGLFPDIYTAPFHSLNLGINKKLGKDRRTVIDIKVSNILNDTKQSLYQAFEAADQIYQSLNPGITFSVGVSHRF